MINTDKITETLEGFNLKPEQIDEILIMLNDFPNNPNETGTVDRETDEQVLRMKYAEEPDWRRKAQIAAAIISKNLE